MYDPNSQKREGYATLLCDNNFKNNLIANTKIEKDQLHSGCMYSDINNRKQDLTLKLLFAINNIKSKTMVVSDITVPIIIYHSKGRLIPLNDWENFFYFLTVFPILFLFGDGEYLGKRQQLVSIETWVK